LFITELINHFDATNEFCPSKIIVSSGLSDLVFHNVSEKAYPAISLLFQVICGVPPVCSYHVNKVNKTQHRSRVTGVMETGSSC